MEHEVDSWIAQLSQCKQLSEADVKTLCDRVRIPSPSPCERLSHPLLSFHLFSLLPLGKGDLDGGVECPAREVSGDRLWRYPWSIRTSPTLAPLHMLGNSPTEPLRVSLLPLRDFSSTIYRSSSASAVTHQIPITSSWAIT